MRSTSLLQTVDSIMSAPRSTHQYPRFDSVPSGLQSSQVSSDSQSESQHSSRWATNSQPGGLDSDSQNSQTYYNDRNSIGRRGPAAPYWRQVNTTAPFVPPSTSRMRRRNTNAPLSNAPRASHRQFSRSDQPPPLPPPPATSEQMCELQEEIARLHKANLALGSTQGAQETKLALLQQKEEALLKENQDLKAAQKSMNERFDSIEQAQADLKAQQTVTTNSSRGDSASMRSVTTNTDPQLEGTPLIPQSALKTPISSPEKDAQKPLFGSEANPTLHRQLQRSRLELQSEQPQQKQQPRKSQSKFQRGDDDEEEEESQILVIGRSGSRHSSEKSVTSPLKDTRCPNVQKYQIPAKPVDQLHVLPVNPPQNQQQWHHCDNSSDEEGGNAEAIDLSQWMRQHKKQNKASTTDKSNEKPRQQQNLRVQLQNEDMAKKNSGRVTSGPTKRKATSMPDFSGAGNYVSKERAFDASSAADLRRQHHNPHASQQQYLHSNDEFDALFQETNEEIDAPDNEERSIRESEESDCVHEQPLRPFSDEFRFTTSSMSQDF